MGAREIILDDENAADIEDGDRVEEEDEDDEEDQEPNYPKKLIEDEIEVAHNGHNLVKMNSL